MATEKFRPEWITLHTEMFVNTVFNTRDLNPTIVHTVFVVDITNQYGSFANGLISNNHLFNPAMIARLFQVITEIYLLHTDDVVNTKQTGTTEGSVLLNSIAEELYSGRQSMSIPRSLINIDLIMEMADIADKLKLHSILDGFGYSDKLCIPIKWCMDDHQFKLHIAVIK